jgi:hypothetical protein
MPVAEYTVHFFQEHKVCPFYIIPSFFHNRTLVNGFLDVVAKRYFSNIVHEFLTR